jgi:integrase
MPRSKNERAPDRDDERVCAGREVRRCIRRQDDLLRPGDDRDLHNWRAREWKTALEAAGIGHGTIYTLRHTFATNAIGAGIGLFELARYMGTGVEMLDRVYVHLVAGTEQAARAKLDAAAGRSGV